MQIKREYAKKLEHAERIRERKENNETELQNVLNAFDSLSNLETKTFLDKIEIEDIISKLKENHVEVMSGFSEQIALNSEKFNEVDEGIGTFIEGSGGSNNE